MLLAACSLTPIWRSRWLPLLDEPNHAASVFIWLKLDEPWARLQEFYGVRFALAPYLLHYAAAYLFGLAAGPEAGNKLALSLYVLALPIAALLLCRRTGRNGWLALLTFPLAYNYNWACGFHAHNFGVAAYLFAVLALDSFLLRPGFASGFTATLLAMVCYLGHPLPLLALYSSLPVLWLAHRTGFKRIVDTAAMMFPSFCIVLYLSVSHDLTPSSTKEGPFIGGPRDGFQALLGDLPRYALDSVSGHVDTFVFMALLTVTLLVSAHCFWRRVGRDPVDPSAPGGLQGWRRVLFDYRLAWLCAAMLLLYFGLPTHLSRPFYWWLVSPRYAFVGIFFLLLIPPVPRRQPGALFGALMLPALTACALLPIHISQKYAEFNQRAAPMADLVGRTRPGSNILFLGMQPRGDPAVNVEVWREGASWVQMLHGGYSPAGFVHDIEGFPYLRKQELPAPSWSCAECFDIWEHGPAYDYILVRNELIPVIASNDPEFRLVAAQGEFRLYERFAPPAAEPPFRPDDDDLGWDDLPARR